MDREDQNNENCKLLKKETETHTHTRRKTNMSRHAIQSHLLVQCDPTQNANDILRCIKKPIRKHKGPQIVKRILNNKDVAGYITISDF